MPDSLAHRPTAETYILDELEVYNWGPFCGRHRAEIHPHGTAIIGTTASGKTTLIDALMTLLTKTPRYNLASTGGHESDRDLSSYVRGIHGDGSDGGDQQRHIRRGRTVTGLCARFMCGEKSVQLAAMFWFDGQSSAASDRKNLWIFCERDDQSLEQWLTLHHEGGARAVNKYARNTAGLSVTNTKTKYLAQVRRFFEVSENAFSLLNRAAGLKQLNNINEIFRDYVLEDHSAFERAAQVVTEFNNLAAIREELEVARRQQQSLIPVQTVHKKFNAADKRLKQHKELLLVLPIWFARCGAKLWEQRVAELGQNIEQFERKSQELETNKRDIKQQEDRLNEIYIAAGGGKISQLKEQVEQVNVTLKLRQRALSEYQKLANKLQLDDTPTRQGLKLNQQQAEQTQALLLEQKTLCTEAAYEHGAKRNVAQETYNELKKEIEKIIARPGSNVPGQFQDFRADLADTLDMTEDALPFVAELVEVKPEEQGWRGAIERALGAHRLRILVPKHTITAALTWVNQRNNRVHVRLLEATEASAAVRFHEDGFTRKLNYKSHALREALKAFITKRCDRHCVDNVRELKDKPFSMTIRGLMSNAAGQFDKHDQRPLDQDWMTGFNNQDRLNSLRAQFQQVHGELAEQNRLLEREKDNAAHIDAELVLLDHVIKLDFETIDVESLGRRYDQLQNNMRELLESGSKVAVAKQKLDVVREQLGELDVQVAELNKELGGVRVEYNSARKQQASAHQRAAKNLTPAQYERTKAQLPALTLEQLDDLGDLERQHQADAQNLDDRLKERQERLHRELESAMLKARNVDTGALVDVGTQLIDVQDYLDRLNLLTKEALPEKLDRFRTYLNQSSDQGVTQLMVGIDNAVAIIEERLEDLNETLGRVDYKSTRFLQLNCTTVVSQGLRALQGAHKSLRSAMLKDDEGESHYRALKNMVGLLEEAGDRRRTLGAKALLDPRYRLDFSVSVIDKATNNTVQTLTGSQGGSGGEKEVIASYILTASLSYALCPAGNERPMFSSIVLDEAFSKTSQKIAEGIVAALRAFGLHPIFVTPNKEMQLLKSSTRSVILVHRKQSRATLCSYSWKELTKMAASRLDPDHEAP